MSKFMFVTVEYSNIFYITLFSFSPMVVLRRILKIFNKNQPIYLHIYGEREDDERAKHLRGYFGWKKVVHVIPNWYSLLFLRPHNNFLHPLSFDFFLMATCKNWGLHSYTFLIFDLFILSHLCSFYPVAFIYKKIKFVFIIFSIFVYH